MRTTAILPLIIAALLLIPFELGAATPVADVQVACAQGRRFSLRIEEQRAIVQSGNIRLLLNRRASSLGQQFASEQASLIIDGDFVAFVPRGDRSWRDCHIDAETDSAAAP